MSKIKGVLIPSLQNGGRAVRDGVRLYFDRRFELLRVTTPSGTARGRLIGLLDKLGEDATKGMVLVHDGARWLRLGVGSNTHVLTADSSEASGIKWAASSGGGGSSDPSVYRPWTKRVMYWQANLGGNNLAGNNNANMGQSGSGSSVVVATGTYVQKKTTTGAGNRAGFHDLGSSGKERTAGRYSPIMECRIRTAALDNTRLWVGLWTWTGAPDNTLTGSNVAHAAFRFAHGTDTNWICSCADGSSQTTTDSGTAVAADTEYLLRIEYDNAASKVKFRIGESGSDIEITSNIPPNTTGLGCVMNALNIAGGSDRGHIQASSCYLETL